MIELDSYIYPRLGKRFGTKKVWVNPNLITHMSTIENPTSRDANGRHSDEMITVTVVCFAAREEETQASVLVTNSPQEILEQIHYWRLHEKEYLA